MDIGDLLGSNVQRTAASKELQELEVRSPGVAVALAVLSHSHSLTSPPSAFPSAISAPPPPSRPGGGALC